MPASTEPLLLGDVTHLAGSDFASPSSAFTNLSALIPEENRLSFSTAVDLAIDLEVTVGECRKSETGCYMLVTGVAKDMVEPIHESMKELGIRKVARFTYEQTIKSLIIRLMPGAAHENVTRSFPFKIQNKVANIPGHSPFSLCPFGDTKFHFPCGGIKEGDGNFKPLDTRGDDGEWPSIVLEVGYSGSLSALRCDAQMWLENAGGRTRMVIIIAIHKNPYEMRLECWGMIPHPNRSNLSTRPWRLDRSQYLDIDHAGIVSPAGHDLVIPYRTLFDISQHGDHDIVISAGELSEWALIMYRLFKILQPQAQ